MKDAMVSLNKLLRRPQSLLGLYGLYKKTAHKAGRHPLWASDLLRGAVVLAFAALDVFIHDRLLQEIRYYVRKGPSYLPTGLKKKLERSISVDSWLSALYRPQSISIIRTTIERMWRFRPLQRADDIASSLEILDIEDGWFWHQMDLGLKLENAKAINFLQQYLERRNSIAHASDVYRSKYKQEKVKKIEPSFVEDSISRVRNFCDAFHRILLLHRTVRRRNMNGTSSSKKK